MYFAKYGIIFHLLKESDLEMVRQWRNAPHIVEHMEYREHITPEMQKKWFESINNVHHLYCVVEYNHEKIGLTNAKNLDFDSWTGEAGIFLYDKKYYRTPVTAIMAILGGEIFFHLLNWKAGFAHVLKENRVQKVFMQMLGYRICPGQEDKINQKFVITRESYHRKRGVLLKLLSVVVNTKEKGKLVIEPGELNDERIRFWEEKMLKGNPDLVVEDTPEGRIYYY
ncbi:MAG TPA: GNAT family N-acetyltransferase [Bacteroidales bacterium]|nr:GNAT family N-acetyltransferase [Bacteroidales bacterium]